MLTLPVNGKGFVDIVTFILLLGFSFAGNLPSTVSENVRLGAKFQSLPSSVISHITNSDSLSLQDVAHLSQTSRSMNSDISGFSKRYLKSKLWFAKCQALFPKFYAAFPVMDSQLDGTATVQAGFGSQLDLIPNLFNAEHFACFEAFTEIIPFSHRVHKLRLIVDAEAVHALFHARPHGTPIEMEKESLQLFSDKLLARLLNTGNPNVYSHLEVSVVNVDSPNHAQSLLAFLGLLLPAGSNSTSLEFDSGMVRPALLTLLSGLPSLYREKAQARLVFKPLLQNPTTAGELDVPQPAEDYAQMVKTGMSIAESSAVESFSFGVKMQNISRYDVSSLRQLINLVCHSNATTFELLHIPAAYPAMKQISRSLQACGSRLADKYLKLNFNSETIGVVEREDDGAATVLFAMLHQALAKASSVRRLMLKLDSEIVSIGGRSFFLAFNKQLLDTLTSLGPFQELIVDSGALAHVSVFAVDDFFSKSDRRRAATRGAYLGGRVSSRGWMSVLAEPPRVSEDSHLLKRLDRVQLSQTRALLSGDTLSKLEWRGYFLRPESIKVMKKTLHNIPSKRQRELALDAFSFLSSESLDKSLRELYSYVINRNCKLSSFRFKLTNVACFGGRTVRAVNIANPAFFKEYIASLLRNILKHPKVALREINGYPIRNLWQLLKDSSELPANVLF